MDPKCFRVIAFGAALSLFAAAPLRAAPLPELKGIMLGQARDDIMASPAISCASTWSRNQCEWKTTISGVSTSIFVTFDSDERVEAIHASAIDAESFETVVGALREKFGNPSTRSVKTAKNLAGATLQNVSYAWRFREWSIVAIERDSSMLQGSVTFSRNSPSAHHDSAAKDVADDL